MENELQNFHITQIWQTTLVLRRIFVLAISLTFIACNKAPVETLAEANSYYSYLNSCRIFMYEFDSSGSNHKVYQSIEANGIPVVWISELVLVRESDHVYAGTIGDGSRFHFDADMRPRYVETPNQSVKRVEFETCTGTDSDWMLSRVSRAR